MLKILPTTVERTQQGFTLQLNVHYHGVFLEGVSLERTDQGRTPRLVKAEPPTTADSAAVGQKISRRVMRTRRTLGSLEAGTDAAAATGDNPWDAATPVYGPRCRVA